VAAPRLRLSALPWKRIVALAIPAPHGLLEFTWWYPSVVVPALAPRPNTPASCGSGRIPIRILPPATEVLNTLAWLAVSDEVWASRTRG
jgi:hypothetical protein